MLQATRAVLGPGYSLSKWVTAIHVTRKLHHVELAEGIARGASTAPWRAIRGLKATEGGRFRGLCSDPSLRGLRRHGTDVANGWLQIASVLTRLNVATRHGLALQAPSFRVDREMLPQAPWDCSFGGFQDATL